MKLSEWHEALLTEMPRAEVLRPPERDAAGGPFAHPLELAGYKFSIVQLWLGYAVYVIEAAAESEDSVVERVICTALPRDRRYRGDSKECYRETDSGGCIALLLGAILRYEAGHQQ